MITPKIIKNHNKNVKSSLTYYETFYRNFYEYIPTYDFSDIKKDSGYIRTLSAIFMPNKKIVNGYNLLANIYNKMINKTNEINFEISTNKAKIKAYTKRIGDLSEQLAKLKQICDSVAKPENYDYCLELDHEKERCKIDLNATITKFDTKHVDEVVAHTTSAYVTGLPYETTDYIVESVPKTVYTKYPDTEKREKARKRLDEIENEIKTIPNYEYNLNLERLYSGYGLLKDAPEYLTKELVNNKLKAKNEKLSSQNKMLNNFLEDFKGYINIEKELIEENQINLSKYKLKELSELKTYKTQKIPERYITASIDDDGFGDEYSLNHWKNVVNEFIDYFGIKNVEKNDMSKVKKDYIKRYDEDLYDYNWYDI